MANESLLSELQGKFQHVESAADAFHQLEWLSRSVMDQALLDLAKAPGHEAFQERIFTTQDTLDSLKRWTRRRYQTLF